MSPEIYARTPDRVILSVYLAPRDDKGRLIREGGRAYREREERLANAHRELPSPAALGMPDEVLQSRVYSVAPAWARMYFQVQRSRGLSVEQTLERWREEGHGR